MENDTLHVSLIEREEPNYTDEIVIFAKYVKIIQIYLSDLI